MAELEHKPSDGNDPAGCFWGWWVAILIIAAVVSWWIWTYARTNRGAVSPPATTQTL
jgi:hypothetical protein